jgi:hypothetical protein
LREQRASACRHAQVFALVMDSQVYGWASNDMGSVPLSGEVNGLKR